MYIKIKTKKLHVELKIEKKVVLVFVSLILL